MIRTAEHLAILGVQLDDTRNRDHGRHAQGLISPDGAAPPLMVIATSEEQMIANHTQTVAAER